MKRIVTYAMIVLLLTGCSQEHKTDPITKPFQPSDQQSPPKTEIVLPEVISIPYEDKYVEFKLSALPFLEMYLKTSSDLHKELSSIKLHHLTESGSGTFYLLSFACEQSHNLCSYILVHKETDGSLSMPVADFTKFHDAVFSPSSEKVMLQFNRPVSPEKAMSDLVIIDLNHIEILRLKNENLTRDVLNYNTSILEKEWINDRKIRIKIPDAKIPADEKGAQWIEFDL
ncbi:MAG: hypothetical protein H0Z32_03650 [Bacillaceae bacterium]|nr:hypothetical protein [Bacillaceae bacterium]